MKHTKFLLILTVIVTAWSAESQAMTLRERVGQLFMIRPEQLDLSLTPDQVHHNTEWGIKFMTPEMLETLKDYPAGGFAVFSKNIASPDQLRHLTRTLKGACKVPPLMAVDEEGGRISRIANTKGFKLTKFKSARSIGAKGNAREAASIIGKYIRDFGFNMNFAPVADINTNPKNIVIGDRAFGSSPELVSRMVSEYLDGLHEQRIAGCIKHFPGHGDTKGDTHSGYVSVSKTWSQLLKAELIPFINNLAKTDSVMIAHITMNRVTGDGLPATLSHELVTGKLREELGYDGVVIVDALKMGAITKHYTSAEAAVLALEAGCDIILMPNDYLEAFDGVLEAVANGRLTESRIDESVNRIMKLKEEYQ